MMTNHRSVLVLVKIYNSLPRPQAVRFHQWPSEQKKSTGEEEAADKKEEKKGPRPTDWRWGPAQYWYDMLNLPEAPEDYDYGLKYALQHMNDCRRRQERERRRQSQVPSGSESQERVVRDILSRRRVPHGDTGRQFDRFGLLSEIL